MKIQLTKMILKKIKDQKINLEINQNNNLYFKVI